MPDVEMLGPTGYSSPMQTAYSLTSPSTTFFSSFAPSSASIHQLVTGLTPILSYMTDLPARCSDLPCAPHSTHQLPEPPATVAPPLSERVGLMQAGRLSLGSSLVSRRLFGQL